jgi:hypothetical protein
LSYGDAENYEEKLEGYRVNLGKVDEPGKPKG